MEITLADTGLRSNIGQRLMVVEKMVTFEYDGFFAAMDYLGQTAAE
jgi:hypothetical protein